jgi:hypothetical protein
MVEQRLNLVGIEDADEPNKTPSLPKRDSPGSSAVEESQFEGEPDDAIEELIESLSESDDAWKVEIYLPNEQGRFDPKAVGRKFVGSLPVTEDLQERILLMFGGGEYGLLFKQKGKVKKQGRVAIADLRRTPDGHSNTFEDEDEDMPDVPSEAEHRLERLENLFASLLEREATKPQPAPLPQPAPPKTLIEQLQELQQAQQLLASLQPPASPRTVAKDDEESAMTLMLRNKELRSAVMSQLTDVLHKPDGETHWTSKIIGALAANPPLVNRLLSTVERFAPKGNGNGAATPSAASDAADGDEGETDETDGEGNDEIVMLQKLAANMTVNAPVSESVALVHEYVRTNPQQAATMGAMMYAPVEQLELVIIASNEGGAELVALPHARAWLVGLQTALKAKA